MKVSLCIGDAVLTISGTDFEVHTSFKAEPVGAAVSAGNDLREPAAAEQDQIVRKGDAPRETDCQAGEVSQGGRDDSSPDTEFQSDGDAFAAVTGKAQLANAAGVEPPPSDTPSSEPSSSEAETKAAGSILLPGPAAANRWAAIRPHCKRPDMCGGSGRNHCRPCKVDAGIEAAA